MEEIIPGQNGLPPKKDSYSAEDKAVLVAKAAELGSRRVAEAYGISWHKIAAWKKYHGRDVEFKGKQKTALVIIQSPDGKEITVANVRRKIVETNVEKIYIRPDQGKAYWVKGKETGEVELW